jgi:O-antigen/teichoic acid export membrane protein
MLMELVWPVEKALYAGYVTVGDQKDKLRDTLLTSVSVVAAIGIPVAIALGQLAAPVVAIVLGPKGAPAVALIQVYVLHGALRSSYSGMFPLFAVLNKPELNTKIVFTSISVRLAFLFCALSWLGLMAVPWSVVVASSLSFLLMWAAVTHELALRWFELPRVLYRSVLAALAMVLAIRWSLGHAVDEPSPWLALGIGTSVGALSYLCASFLLWHLTGRPAGAERLIVGLVRAALSARKAAPMDP